MVIKTNISGIHAWNQADKQLTNLQKTVEKLSSGLRINRAADDIAGLGVSETLRAQVTEINRCQLNAREGLDVTKTADGALEEINNMLRRGHELCIQAANGIYGEDEQNAISLEMNVLFDEIDRITAGTTHNNIQLFRYDGINLDPPIYDAIVGFDYEEIYTLTDDSIKQWGDLDLIGDKEIQFTESQSAKSATITLTMDDEVKASLADAKVLDGKSMILQGTRYTFSKTGSTDYSTGVINVGSGSIQDAFNSLVNITKLRNTIGYSTKALEKAEVDAVAGTVKLSYSIEDYEQMIHNVTDKNGIVKDDQMNFAPDADGSYANNIIISSADGFSLKDVDGIDNKFTFATETDYRTITLPDRTLTASEIDQLTGADASTFTFGPCTVSLKGKNITTSTSMKDIRDMFITELNNVGSGKLEVSADGDVGIKVKVIGLSADSFNLLSINESIPSASYKYQNCNSMTATTTVITPPGNENFHEKKFTLGSMPAIPFTINIGGAIHTFFDSSTFEPGYSLYSYNGYPHDMNGVDKSTILSTIASALRSAIGKDGTVTLSGNDITLKGTVLGKELPTNIEISSGITGGKISTIKRRSAVLMNTSYFERDTYVSIEPPALDKLVGTGFGLKSSPSSGASDATFFEFVNGTESTAKVNAIDIAGCTTMADVATKMQEVLQNLFYSRTTVVENGGKINITLPKGTSTSSGYGFEDGFDAPDGVFSNNGEKVEEKFAGGTIADQPHTTIDFSSINSENLDTLLGKGFRVTCATCSDEYINVIFCHSNKDGKIPESFDITSADGAKRTIRNIVVELSKVTDGDSIVKNIVDQVTPHLTHYTDMKVGDPPSMLNIMDKRVGNQLDINDDLLQAEIISGVKTNFTYVCNKIPIHESDLEKPDNPDDPNGDGMGGLDIRKLYIYAGSHPQAQFVPIHLPYLDLKVLNLRPPEVDLAAGQEPDEWLSRVDKANSTISSARGILGADHNRLEHLESVLAEGAVQTTASESRIRDADMAKLVAEQMKYNVLAQAQQSMMSHSNMLPQQVLELLK